MLLVGTVTVENCEHSRSWEFVAGGLSGESLQRAAKWRVAWLQEKNACRAMVDEIIYVADDGVEAQDKHIQRYSSSTAKG